jgi:nucleoside phosphorylase
MIKIVTAIYCEAKPIIDFFNLKRSNSDLNFNIYSNDSIELIISGVGSINSAIATTYFITKYKNTTNIINFGVCGSTTTNLQIGSIFFINKISSSNFKKKYYPDILVKHDFPECSICSYNSVITNISEYHDLDYDLIDMESYTFYSAANKFIFQHNISVIKLISDYLDTKIVNPDFISSLIKQNIQSLSIYINYILEYQQYAPKNDLLSSFEQHILTNIVNNLKFTEYMKNEFIDYAKYYKLKKGNLNVLNNFEYLEISEKNERKNIYEFIKSKLFI